MLSPLSRETGSLHSSIAKLAPVIRQTLSSSYTLVVLGTDQSCQRQGDQDDKPVGGIDPERLDL